MELQTITSDRNAAREAFLDYRRAFAADHAAIDGELMRGYKALAAGKQLIRLSETIKAGGFDDQGRPKLAVARADEEQISFSRWGSGALTFTPNIQWRDSARSGDRVLSLGEIAPAGTTRITQGTWVAMTPIIPPKFRPPQRIENFHLLWEAEWIQPQRRQRAPLDPALLRRVGGDLFAVLAIWDLSPLERAVLELR